MKIFDQTLLQGVARRLIFLCITSLLLACKTEQGLLITPVLRQEMASPEIEAVVTLDVATETSVIPTENVVSTPEPSPATERTATLEPISTPADRLLASYGRHWSARLTVSSGTRAGGY